MAGIELIDIHKTYRVDNREIPVLNGINLSLPAGRITVILGQSGCGKTHLCSAVAVQLLKDGMGLRYMVWRDELRKLKAVANSPEYGEMLDEWKTVRVLYIDDFFKAARDQYGRMQPSEADVRIAFELLNYRSNDKSLLTIISSELSLDEIADIDEAIAGRIAQHAAGHCVTVAPDRGKNYRLKGVVSL